MSDGKHLIAGAWIGGEECFANMPVEGPSERFPVGTEANVNAAAAAAEAAFASYASLSRTERASFLRAIADEIEVRGPALTDMAMRETGLPQGRLEGERGRTTGQLRLFADHIECDGFLDLRHDPAMPERQPLPRPDLRLMQRPLGPVAVFGASNFPLAFSVAGGDTASALAAGCPVVVKGHEAHPGTSEIVADAIATALAALELPSGVFSMIHGGSREIGRTLVTHPAIRAVGFTGSIAGGRALFDLCAQRAEPIPFFGELGSINPVFLLPEALEARAAKIADGWAASLTLGAGQFCTKPGVVVAQAGPALDAFTEATARALEGAGAQVMLTDAIAEAYRASCARIAHTDSVRTIVTVAHNERQAGPHLFHTTGRAWLDNVDLGEEVFGAAGLIVAVADVKEFLTVAEKLDGQLTCTMHLDAADTALAQQLLPVLERKAGRLLANGFPTGVEVGHAMVHGGPYPASTNFGHTSVGTLAIRRWLRPVCYQNIPSAILPADIS